MGGDSLASFGETLHLLHEVGWTSQSGSCTFLSQWVTSLGGNFFNYPSKIPKSAPMLCEIRCLIWQGTYF